MLFCSRTGPPPPPPQAPGCPCREARPWPGGRETEQECQGGEKELGVPQERAVSKQRLRIRKYQAERGLKGPSQSRWEAGLDAESIGEPPSALKTRLRKCGRKVRAPSRPASPGARQLGQVVPVPASVAARPPRSWGPCGAPGWGNGGEEGRAGRDRGAGADPACCILPRATKPPLQALPCLLKLPPRAVSCRLHLAGSPGPRRGCHWAPHPWWWCHGLRCRVIFRKGRQVQAGWAPSLHWSPGVGGAVPEPWAWYPERFMHPPPTQLHTGLGLQGFGSYLGSFSRVPGNAGPRRSSRKRTSEVSLA